MLIRCPDCGREVSDQAPACPGCGRPAQGVQAIERTGKRLKAQVIGAVVIFCAGLLLFGSDLVDDARIGTPGWIGAGVAAAGFTWSAAAEFLIWWRHG